MKDQFGCNLLPEPGANTETSTMLNGLKSDIEGKLNNGGTCASVAGPDGAYSACITKGSGGKKAHGSYHTTDGGGKIICNKK